MRVVCHDCQNEKDFDPLEFCCACGSPWEPAEDETFIPSDIKKQTPNVWRYQNILQLKEIHQPVSLSAGWTPLMKSEWNGVDVLFKLEYITATGSFKDRGTEVEISFLKAMGVDGVVEDSSGNAGASVAAYAARAGITADIYAPVNASPAKLSQIEIYGAELHKIPGPRMEATKAVKQAVDDGAVYASHAFNPAYLLGQQTFAWEVWEQTKGTLPDVIIFPVGQCGLLMGAWLGFRRLLNAGVVEKIPRLFAAQPERLAPIHHAMKNGLDDIEEFVPTQKSIAEGLAIVKPVRSKRILQALHESKGRAVVVSENQIYEAYVDLAQKGFFVEPSSAVAAAAISIVRKDTGKDTIIMTALSGSGLKTPVLRS